MGTAENQSQPESQGEQQGDNRFVSFHSVSLQSLGCVHASLNDLWSSSCQTGDLVGSRQEAVGRRHANSNCGLRIADLRNRRSLIQPNGTVACLTSERSA